MRLNHFAIAAMIALTACSPGHADSSAASAAPAEQRRHPISNLPVIPVTVTAAKGAHTIEAELAATFEEQQKGLMFRTYLDADEGMLFPRTPPDQARFWMHNTVIPLDLVFIGRDRRVLNIAANAVPYDETPIPAAGIASAVLELRGGRAAELGIAPGDKVDW